jgi:hypothetical protein
MTKNLTRIFAILLFVAIAAQAESLLKGKVTVELPEDFGKLSKEILDAKFQGANRPTMAYGNTDGTVTIAGRAIQGAVPDSDLASFSQEMSQGIQKARPDVKFQTNEVTTINGHKWIHFVFISEAYDGPIRNEMLVASKNNEIYILNLNATMTEYPSYAKGLESARKSLRLK